MKLREEMVERLIAAPTNQPLTGWTIKSESWNAATQAAVDQIMVYTSTLLEMVLRLAEAIDELRDTVDIEGDENI
jgi:hypothetical protein